MTPSRLALLSAFVFANSSWGAILCKEKLQLFEEALMRPDHVTLDASQFDEELRAFEAEALEIMASDPSSDLAWANLGRRWEIADEELKTIKAYYRLLRRENATTDSLAKDLSHLSDLGRKRFFEENPDAKDRYDFYKASVGHLSAPEMAKHLGTTEIRVRREMSQWQVSIIAAFGDDTGDGSTQASRFVRHSLNIASRRILWTRKANFEGKLQSEADILKILHKRGFDSVQIAKRLNEIFSTSEDERAFRTVGAVNEKKRELELVSQRPHETKDLEIPGYGSVKEAGVLIVTTSSRFIFENRDKGEKWIAAQLSVTLENLRAFNKRHGLDGFFKKNIPETIRKERQSVLDKYATHLIKTGQFLSTQNDKDWTAVTGISIDKILGYGRYADEKPQAHLRLFNGLSDFYVELHAATKKVLSESDVEAASQLRILDSISAQEKQHRLSKVAIEDQRENAQERLLAHLLAGNPPKMPASSAVDFTLTAGVEYEKWTGQGYWQGKFGDGPALHESPLAAFENLYEFTRNYFENADVDPKKQEAVLLELESKISFHQRALLKDHEKNRMVYESLYAHLLEKKSFPSSAYSVWTKSVPFSYTDFTTEFNTSPGLAFRRFHRWLKAKLKSDNIEADRQQELLSLADSKAFDFEFEAMPFHTKRKVAAQRIITHFIRAGVFPNNADLKKDTGIGAARFYNYKKEDGEEVLNRNAQEAFILLAAELEDQLRSRKIPLERREELRRIFEAARSARR